MLEHGAYTLLLDRYYSTEQGIPEDQAHRVCRARSVQEKGAVDAILKEFFVFASGSWTHQRADDEISKMKAKAVSSRTNGKAGGRPRKNLEGTQEKPTGFPLGTQDEPKENLSQEPITKGVNLKPKTQAAAAIPMRQIAAAADYPGFEPDPDPIGFRAAEIASMLRKRGAALQAADPRVRSWASSGVSDGSLLSALEKAQRRRNDSGTNQPIGAGLIGAIMSDGSNNSPSGPTPYNPFAGAI